MSFELLNVNNSPRAVQSAGRAGQKEQTLTLSHPKLLSAGARLRLPILLCLPWMALHADVVYSSFGPGQSFNSGPLAGSFANFQIRFVVTGSGNLQRIVLPLAYMPWPVGGPPLPPMPDLGLGLYTDASGRTGTLLEPWTEFKAPSFSGGPKLQTFDSVLHPALTAGAAYWFVVLNLRNSGIVALGSSPDISTGGFWSGALGAPPTHILPTAAPPALEVDAVNSVPEPETWLLMAGVLLALFVSRGARRRLPSRAGR